MKFTPDEGAEVAFSPAPISKADARQIGLAFCEASEPEREALLADLGPLMVRRSLLVFSNLAARMGEPDAAAYARDLRSGITALRVYKTEAAS
ncbi:hypothetical protein [Nocardioides sp. cx-173]|uniref:hypothetical protein n=1 Tax=Nocardioides sp. cx-173 TaxID=2898796 RepID=UPI001E519876|nr:hypothetical protein [Nocardioides sp. cx-173]MCD4527451.1 hypothetical protein [Nocardioides sp. cx-173]UGB40409.1 hypothetical protein LQ940_13585 [Nocardioides sp. cx-173]